jgi:hypothetical protein
MIISYGYYKSIFYHLVNNLLPKLCLLNTQKIDYDGWSQHESSHMKFNNFIYIFLGPGLNPQTDRAIIKNDQVTFTTVGIDFQHKDLVIDVAKEAIINGAQMIELCGGFGPLWIAKVNEAIHGKVPVGSVAYGPEARKPLLDLLSE